MTMVQNNPPRLFFAAMGPGVTIYARMYHIFYDMRDFNWNFIQSLPINNLRPGTGLEW